MHGRRHTVPAAAIVLFAIAANAPPVQAVPITIYQDLDLSGAYDPGEERTGGANGNGGATYDYAFDLDSGTQNLAGAALEITFSVWRSHSRPP